MITEKQARTISDKIKRDVVLNRLGFATTFEYGLVSTSYMHKIGYISLCFYHDNKIRVSLNTSFHMIKVSESDLQKYLDILIYLKAFIGDVKKELDSTNTPT